MAEKRPVVLHIATDFPDGSGGNSTRAVANLLSATDDEIEHQVVSVQRVKKPVWKLEGVSTDLLRIQFFSPPYGLFSNLMMFFVSLWLFARLRHRKIDLIHAHKLTTDGPLGYFLSLWSGWPLTISVRGDTDSRFIRYKPFSRWLFRHIVKCARHIFWVSAWARAPISTKLHIPAESEKYSLLPNIVTIQPLPATTVAGQQGAEAPFVFIGKLSQADKKGLWMVLDAMAVLRDKGTPVELDIYGGGSTDVLATVNQRIESLKLDSLVNYRGKVPLDELSRTLPSYAALVMPSSNETFGMVYVEALFSGIPVIGCSQSGIDEYLPGDKQYVVQVSRDDPRQLVEAMQSMQREHQRLKAELRTDISRGSLDMFTSETISRHYVQIMQSVSCLTATQA